MQPSATPVKTGRIRRGWALTKSSWLVLKLDKELTAMPVIAAVVSVLALIPFALIGILGMGLISTTNTPESFEGYVSYPFLFAVYMALGLVANFFAVAVSHAVLERFQGNDPTIRGSIRAARSRLRSIFAFTLLATTIGLILQVLEDRLPFAGKIAVWLANAAWSIATLFAIPILAASDNYVKPLDAVRQSASTIKQVWGESVVSQISLGLIALLFMLPSTIAVIGGTILLVTAGSTVLGVLFGILGGLALITMGLVFSVLGAIAKTAVYHYAVTGTAPSHFNRELLQAAMTQKKARKVFAS